MDKDISKELEPQTPYLLLDKSKTKKNINRIKNHIAPENANIRLHVKTTKSLETAKLFFTEGPGPIAVSTLSEAEHFFGAGYTEILYAVGISPQKLLRVTKLRHKGVDLIIVLDSIEQAKEVSKFSKNEGICIPALIEIDCDGHRGGVVENSKELLEIAYILANGGAEVRGVMAHAGESYFLYKPEERAAAAENECATVLRAVKRLRASGHAAPVVSIGSTPTAHAVKDLTGITEVRAGNFVFFDLVMSGIGVCDVNDLALTVVATVIGHKSDKNWIITDAGWMAISGDRGTRTQKIDQGFGLVASRDGRIYPDLVQLDAMQEHGIIGIRPGSNGKLPYLPIGTEVLIFPNHACATASQHSSYYVINKPGAPIVDVWQRLSGW